MTGERISPPLTEETAEHFALEDFLEYFSESTLELLGFDAAADVINAKFDLQRAVALGDEIVAVNSRADTTSIQENSSSIIPFTYDSPKAEHTCQQLAQIFFRVTHTKVSDDLLIGSLHKSFDQNRAFIPVLDRSIVDRNVMAYEEEVRIMSEIETVTTELLQRHDQTDDAMEKAMLLCEAGRDFSKIVPMQPKEKLWYCLQAAVIKEVFEQLEQECGEDIALLLRRFGVVCRRLQDTLSEEDVIVSNALSSQDMVRYMRRIETAAHQSTVHVRVAHLFDRYWHLLPDASAHGTERIMQVGIRAVQAAEAAIGAGEPTSVENIDFSQGPFTLLDPTSSDLPRETEALFKVMHGARLHQVRKEVGAVLTTVDSQYKHAFDAAWEQAARPEEWSRSLATARQMVTGMITRKLDRMKDSVKPLADVVEGRKARPKKKGKPKAATYSAEATAESIYNMLHREGGFAESEKSLVAAIASGRWEALKDLRKSIAPEYAFLAAFTEDSHCPDVLKKHPLTSVMGFSEHVVLGGVRAKLEGRAGKILAALNVEQAARIRTALDALGNEA